MEKIYDKFADLLLKTGIGLQEGGKLVLTAEPVHWDFINRLEQRAYELGAAYVHTELYHPKGLINRCNYRKEEYIDYVPSFQKSIIDTYVEEEWSFIYFDGMEDPDILGKLNQDSFASYQKALLKITKPAKLARIKGKCPWCISALPTDNWAKKIFGDDATKEDLWKLLADIYRLDEEDPSAVWKEHSDKLMERSDFLNKNGVRKLHFIAEDTDLQITLSPLSRWKGGGDISQKGVFYLPNIPTEEVFTSPDYRLTEGRVKVTRPVKVLGDYVKGAWFEFKDGKVVDYGADKGRELLENFFKIDPKALYLGEVALVDVTSPIYQSEKIFHSILFDENATCHIALGSGFPMTYAESDNKSEEELNELGCNKAMLHTDFMIGSDKLSVTGFKDNGEEIKIIENGKFVI